MTEHYTSNPCPSWCALPPGHEYDSVRTDQPSILVRTHARDLCDDVGPVSLTVSAEDSAQHDESDQLIEAAELVMWTGCDRVDLTAEQALELADALTRAAVAYERISGSPACRSGAGGPTADRAVEQFNPDQTLRERWPEWRYVFADITSCAEAWLFCERLVLLRKSTDPAARRAAVAHMCAHLALEHNAAGSGRFSPEEESAARWLANVWLKRRDG